MVTEKIRILYGEVMDGFSPLLVCYVLFWQKVTLAFKNSG